MNQEEQWLPLVGFENGYEVSSFGHIRSKPRFVPCKGGKTRLIPQISIKFYTTIHGYNAFNPTFERRRIAMSVHRAVALTFLPNPENKPEVNHKNGVKTDNRVENLEWATKSENIKHSFCFLGKKTAKGKDNGLSKLIDDDVIKIRTLWQSGGITQTALASKWGIHQTCVHRIVSGETWKHLLAS